MRQVGMSLHWRWVLVYLRSPHRLLSVYRLFLAVVLLLRLGSFPAPLTFLEYQTAAEVVMLLPSPFWVVLCSQARHLILRRGRSFACLRVSIQTRSAVA
jgi:hypothetical protein